MIVRLVFGALILAALGADAWIALAGLGLMLTWEVGGALMG